MTEFDLSTYRDRTYDRLVNTFDMSHEQANFVIAYALYTKYNVEEALNSIHDYLNSMGL